MQYFNIQVASQLSGVASATIRAWEKRYSAVNPERAENKHRLYSETDIEKLALLYKLTELGQSIGKIAHLELTDLREVYTRLMHRPYDERHVVTPHHEKIDHEKMLGNLLLALKTYKLDIISHELEKAKAVLTPRELALHIIVPLFHETGIKVATGELSIAQEHALTSMTFFHLGSLMGQHYQRSDQSSDLLVLATPEGDPLEMGLLVSALLCVHYEVRFIYLGTCLPAQALAQATNALNPRAVLLNVTRSPSEVMNYLNSCKSKLTVSSEIWLGGEVESIDSSEVEKKIRIFSTLQALDEFLSNVNHTYKQ